MYHNSEYLALAVPGLSEGRPSLLVGDRVILTSNCYQSRSSPAYEGYIHEVCVSAVQWLLVFKHILIKKSGY